MQLLRRLETAQVDKELLPVQLEAALARTGI
jgi:hypothetical protein